MRSNEYLIELKDVSVYFTERVGLLSKRVTKALDHVNLRVSDGDVIAVVGESGAGKTTMGRVILGLQKPTSGVALFRGKDIYSLKGRNFEEFRREVQWVPQDPYSSLDPSLTIGEQLMAPIRRWNPKIDASARAQELLRLVGLVPPSFYMNKYPHQLSGGQRQRIAIARSLASNPRLIIADEPVTMIDSSLRISFINTFIDLIRIVNLSLIFITHDIALARILLLKSSKGRIVILKDGRIVEEGDINEIISNPKDEYTKVLINAAPDLKRWLKAYGEQ
ncbi:ABC transporter ATP-binding protein [Caldivirga sp. UBA161]|uniref:ABC transporter ATP-binding protein n=1 Tax=Caldivirga sp. UBA161 TaxID=1915569 RepID=UPI0025C70EB9|nr:ABC transporter ATP-binding protein [Caldivirga sp. UBA161]